MPEASPSPPLPTILPSAIVTWPLVTLMEELVMCAISILSVWVPIASVASLLAIVRLLTFPVVSSVTV